VDTKGGCADIALYIGIALLGKPGTGPSPVFPKLPMSEQF
jgi:hypothetical protein